MTIGEKIAFFRKKKGFSQEQIAELLEMTPNGYGKIERNETDLPYSRLEWICKVLNIPPHKLLGFAEEQINVSNGNLNYGDHNCATLHNYSEQALAQENAFLKKENEFLRSEIENLKEINALLKEKKG